MKKKVSEFTQSGEAHAPLSLLLPHHQLLHQRILQPNPWGMMHTLVGGKGMTRFDYPASNYYRFTLLVIQIMDLGASIAPLHDPLHMYQYFCELVYSRKKQGF
ncbi:MAG: hypothetical protein QNJ51_25305 [Calothrix sp. MO_167.B12]|nr:hypothetical protein [Calothrix sp. MO_167.B12]